MRFIDFSDFLLARLEQESVKIRKELERAFGKN